MPELQSVDPAISRSKFDREIARYRECEEAYRRQGWFLLDARFPEAVVVFSATRLKPAALVAAVVLDFTNYDLRPPSVRFVDPFTREPLRAKDLTIQMLRRPHVPDATPETITLLIQSGQLPLTNLIQAFGPDDFPFLCLPGVREYHDHPAHTGDSWLLHRRSGEGSLHFILEQIWKYGVNPIEQFQAICQVKVTGVLPSAQAIPE